MKWFLLVFAVALAGPAAARANAQVDRADTSGGVVTLPSAGGGAEAVPGVVITLPGPPATAAAPEAGSPKVAEGAVPRVPPASDDQPPVLRRSAPVYPPEFERDSALFCQTRIGQWTEADARALLGDASLQRLALGEDQSETGLILAFADPTGRYQQLELDFAGETGALRGVFAYPWNMTWRECRRLWGARVTARKANQGRTFYSYLNRRLDVLVDRAGKVVSLGLY
jgi:hypothetical protein